MKEEIISGIRNAMQRSSSYEEVIQSFINAGYNEGDVREAGKSLSGGVSEIINWKNEPEAPYINDNSLPPLPLAKKKDKNKRLIILIVVIGIIAVGLMSYLAYYLMRS